ncbi:MAG: response regulator [Leptolyngbyaceae cyanobacterium]
MKILVVEDDAGLTEVLVQALSKQHYQVETAIDGEAGWELAEIFEYDLVLLDLHLPKLNGIEFCRRLRARKHNVPVLLMTAEDTQASKVIGLDAGADDYVTKPLDLEELLARVRALLRRGRCESVPTLSWGPVSVDPSTCEVFCHKQPLHLAGKQYEILELFLRYPNRIFSSSALIERLWSLDNIPSENAIRTHIKNLRNKLREHGVEEIFETVYGLGYRLLDAPQDSAPPSQPVLATPTSDIPAPASAIAPAASREPAGEFSAAIWERHQSKYLELITALDAAVSTLQAVEPTATSAAGKPSVLERSQKDAHQLKGALGCFGFIAASQIAAQIEHILLAAASPSKAQAIDQLPSLIEQLRQALTIPVKSAVEAVPSYPQLDRVRYRWLIINGDKALNQELTRQASSWNIQTSTAATLNQAKQALEQRPFDVVMLTLDDVATSAEDLAFLLELKQQQPSSSVIVVTAEDTLADRVNVLRLSECTFLQKPLTAAQVLATVLQNLPPTPSPIARILALDDDPQILQYLEQVLLPWGFQITLASDPVQFWDILKQTPPDLLILDIEMPGFNGLELCQVIRSDPTLGQLPILCLSAHTEPDLVRQVFAAGADDYLSKPLMSTDLIARIVNRLKRVQRLPNQAEIDDFTGFDCTCRESQIESF